MVASRFTAGAFRGHHNDRFHPQRPGRIGHALSMIAAGIGNDAPPPFLIGQGGDLVVSTSQLERSDRLQIFRLEIEPAAVRVVVRFVDMRGNERGARGNATQARLRVAKVVESDDEGVSTASS